jgi:hypothetical protein
LLVVVLGRISVIVNCFPLTARYEIPQSPVCHATSMDPFGFLTRLAALGIAVDMIVAIFMVHLPYGLFMNWYGNQKGEGYEYHLLAIAIALTLTIAGGGILSIDRSIAAPKLR